MEANPGTVECGDPAGYREAGVNRLSHRRAEFRRRMRCGARAHSRQRRHSHGRMNEAREAGFDNINLDLMYGLPGQTSTRRSTTSMPRRSRARTPLLVPADARAEHGLSRPAARGAAGRRAAFEIQDAGRRGEKLLAELGYEQYEVSAWARDGMHCRHNLNYWSFGDYLAVGAGAHGKITEAEPAVAIREAANPKQYMTSLSDEAFEAGAAARDDDRLFEFMLNALRLPTGFRPSEMFVARTGLAPECGSSSAWPKRDRRPGLLIERRAAGTGGRRRSDGDF